MALGACCVCRGTQQQAGFVKQCCGWGDRSWPIRARLGDLLCRSAQDRKERESCLNGVTIEQGYCRSHLGRMANMAVGHALQQTLSYLHVGCCKTHITLTLPEISHCSRMSNLNVLTLHSHIYNSDTNLLMHWDLVFAAKLRNTLTVRIICCLVCLLKIKIMIMSCEYGQLRPCEPSREEWTTVTPVRAACWGRGARTTT